MIYHKLSIELGSPHQVSYPVKPSSDGVITFSGVTDDLDGIRIMQFSNSTRDFINIVTNPLDSNKPAQVPDLQQFNSLCLVDSAHITNPVNPTLSTAAGGIIAWVRCHYSTMDSANNPNPNRIYTLNYTSISSANVILSDAGGDTRSVVPVNMTTILGGTQYTPNSALITSCRVMSMGLQLLSTVEVVTDTSQIYITQIVGGQMSMSELNSINNNNSDVLLALKNSSCSKIFSNSEGCSGRYDPFQNEEQLNVLDGSLMYSTAKAFDWYKMPVIIAKFSQTVASGSQLPVILNARFWIEASLRQPTPIYSQPSPIDPNFSLVRSILSGCTEVFPLVAKGHSFTAFVSSNPRIISVISRVLQQSSVFLNRINKGRLPIQRKRNGRNKKRNKNNNNRNNNGGNSQLPGAKKQLIDRKSVV